MELRQLIINADDFGISAGVNRGIIEAHVHGVVTSASAMTRWPAASEAAELARTHPNLGMGLHVDLGEWIYRDGRWQALYEVVRADDADTVEREVRRQLDDFRELFGRDPDHLDSHQHAHRDEPARSVLLRIAREIGVPLRHFSPIEYRGEFYGQSDEGESFPDLIGVDALMRILGDLPAGATELGCHPGYSDGLHSMYASERQIELQTLCDPRVREFLDRTGVRLCSAREASVALFTAPRRATRR